jgi:hypothetical protein
VVAVWGNISFRIPITWGSEPPSGFVPTVTSSMLR